MDDEQLERKDAAGVVVEEPVKTEGLHPSPDTSERSEGASSPPPNCSICLGKLINTSFTDSCLHQFCFTCLLQWSKIKTECPLCKQTFKSIIHNVRSEEDYDQYHVPRELASQLPSSQVAASLDVNFELVGGVADVGLRRFVYRTTMMPNRRYGVLLNPEQVARRAQIPNVSAPSRHRRANQTGYRRNVYRLGEWSNLLPDVYGRFRECSADYYRRHPNELNRLIPWINRELQTLLNANEPHIAYVLRIVMDALSRYDIRSAEFRDMVRPYFGQFTDHFAHELLNYARSSFDLIGYDQYVTYSTLGNLEPLSGYTTRIISPNSSPNSTSSDDSDVLVLDETIDVSRISAEFPSTGPHIIDMPGPSMVGEAFQISRTTPEAPDVLTISSSPSSSEECAVVGYVKPRHERTPEIIELLSSDGVSEPSNNYDVNSRGSTLHENETERPGPSREDRCRVTRKHRTKKSARRSSRRRWSTTTSSETNDEASSEYSSHHRKKSLHHNQVGSQTRDHARNTRSRDLTELSPKNTRQRRTSTSASSTNDLIYYENMLRKFRDRTKILKESLLISDSESSASSNDDRNKRRIRRTLTRKDLKKNIKRLEDSLLSGNESDNSDDSKSRDRERGRSKRKTCSRNGASCSTEISSSANRSDKVSEKRAIHATILRKDERKPDEWYVKKNSSRGTSSSWSSSSESDIKTQNPPRRITIREYKERRNAMINPGCSGNDKRDELTESKAQNDKRFVNQEGTENSSSSEVTNESNGRCHGISGRTRAKGRSRGSKSCSRKRKIQSESSDSSDSVRSKNNDSGTRNEHAIRKSSDSRDSQTKSRKDSGNKNDRAKRKDRGAKSSKQTRNNRRSRDNERDDRDDYVRKKSSKTCSNHDEKNNRGRTNNHTRKYDEDERNRRSNKYEQIANNDHSKKRNDQHIKSSGKRKDHTRRSDETIQEHDTPTPRHDQAGSSKHSQNEKESPSRDKHKRKKKQKLKRRRSRSESKSESRKIKHRMARSSSYTPPSTQHSG